MGIKSMLADGKGGGDLAHVHRRGKNAGLLVYTDDFPLYTPSFPPLLNDTFGADMNQNVTFGGTPEGIHDGTDSALWTAAAVQGSWDFASTTNPDAGTKCVELTDGDNADEATFSDGTSTDMSGRTALTGRVRLETYSGTNNTIILTFQNDNVDVGNSVNLNDYINTETLDAYQSFVIPKADFGISSETVDELDIELTRVGGTKPVFRFDTIQIEETGSPAVFEYQPEPGKIFRISDIGIALMDTISEANAKDPINLLGVSALSNGINVLWTINDGEATVFNGTINRLADLMQFAEAKLQTVSDGTTTLLKVDYQLQEFAPTMTQNDVFRVTINDDLSGLLLFRLFLRAIEVTDEG